MEECRDECLKYAVQHEVLKHHILTDVINCSEYNEYELETQVLDTNWREREKEGGRERERGGGREGEREGGREGGRERERERERERGREREREGGRRGRDRDLIIIITHTHYTRIFLRQKFRQALNEILKIER